ncbi:YdcF family protein [Tissierella sp.]|uniref:YdcF family protein n=1 Tax=Tissierella sp. TaxID=41274 RepID=UPI00285B8814|nr:YdcF family protein [Tissierella sp.]MDR7857855.1 YdcF family protein [Tissierella sp.]
MYIPKYPEVPDLTDNQIEEITEITFGEEEGLNSSDVIFVFGSTHPPTYQNAFEAYNKGLGKEIIISGGSSGSKDKHKDWIYGDKAEARVIYEKLASLGVPEQKMFLEEKSKNSRENILFAKEIYDFSKVNSLIFISKNYAAGRQCRTLKKYLPKAIKISSYTYNTYFDDGSTFNRHDWMKHERSKSLVFGEYLRIVYYGKRGDIEELNYIDQGLKEYIELTFIG